MSCTDAVPDKPKSVWTSLEVAKLIAAALVPVSIAATGAYLTQKDRQKEEVRAHWEAIDHISRAALHRRVRAELLASALRRDAKSPTEHSLQELKQRKQAYDEAYVDWNANIGRYMLTLRRASGDTQYTQLESKQQRALVNTILKPMDACLTEAYDQAMARQGSKVSLALDACNIRGLLQQSLDCTYEITDQAYLLAFVRTAEPAALPSGRCPIPIPQSGL